MVLFCGPDGPVGQFDYEIERLQRLVADLKAIKLGAAPSAQTLNSSPVIHLYTLAARDDCLCLKGVAEGHPRLGTRHVLTSDLWVMAPRHGWARTLSRFYRLGRPLGAPEDG